jgi:hypothetical protein
LTSTLQERFDAKYTPEPNTGCWLWFGAVDGCGYGKMMVKGVLKGAHRLSLILTGVEIPAGAYVCHKCDNPCCVNPEHLFIGSPRDNTKDAFKKGRIVRARGTTHYASRFSERDVLDIIKRFNNGERPVDIARVYQAPDTTVHNVIKGNSWSWLTNIKTGDVIC